jgi:superfamily II DNA/RNA helicase
LTGVQIMVVDEADRMLDMGFIPDLERIFKMTPAQKQTLFFSATMPPEITRLTTQFLKDPIRIEASRPATTGENISQFIAKIPLGDPKAKRMTLRALIERSEVSNGIVFCNRKSEVDIVAKSLKVHGLDAAPIHGDLDQSTRMKTLESFRRGELKLLVASDVAARGLDIPAVSHVFNYDVPHHAEDYVHRIGRTGRAGRTGEAFMIVTPNDVRSYEKVLKLTKKEPATVTVDLDWDEARIAGERDNDRRRARGGERERPRGRREERSRPVKDHGERASMEAFVQPATPRVAPEPIPATPASPRPAPRASGADSVRERPPAAPRRPTREPETVEGVAAGGYGHRLARATDGPDPRPERAPDRAPDRAPGRAPERTSELASERAPERVSRADEARRPGREPPRPREDAGPTVLGFGPDTPAFLMRGPPLALGKG